MMLLVDGCMAVETNSLLTVDQNGKRLQPGWLDAGATCLTSLLEDLCMLNRR